MLDLLKLLIFYKNKETFDESKSFQKEREKRRTNKEKKKERERGDKNAFPKVFVKYLQNRLCNDFEIFSRSFFIYFGQKIQNINVSPLPTPI